VRGSIYIYVRGGWLQSAASPSLLVSKSLLCRAHNFFRPPLSYKPFLAFFSYGRQPRKILVFRLVKRTFPYTEICLPVPISGGNDYIPEAYVI